jgi:hypothetical protein
VSTQLPFYTPHFLAAVFSSLLVIEFTSLNRKDVLPQCGAMILQHVNHIVAVRRTQDRAENFGVASPSPSHTFLDRYAGKVASLLDNCFTRFVFDSVLDDAAQYVGLSITNPTPLVENDCYS